MNIRDRIKELRRVPARLLRPHPRNWRTHPDAQRDALRGVLAEIGYANALLARQLDDGTLELIDGHLRAETTPESEVPVLVLDLDQHEAEKLLAVLDPLAALAETDHERLAELAADFQTDSAAVRALVDRLVQKSEAAAADAPPSVPPDEVDVPESYQVVVECRDEAEQQAIYERLTGEGYRCKLRML
jgi:ParB-like chromosome segregation protein Spo0J